MPGRNPPPLIIGVPCHHRQWCLEQWFESLRAQQLDARTELVFMLSDPSDPSLHIIYQQTEALGLRTHVEFAAGLPAFEEDEKDHPARYSVLAEIRNRLLRIAAAASPEFYLSWDSDILLDNGAVSHLLELADRRGNEHPPGVVAGALVDMGGATYPGHLSMMALHGTDAYRYDELAEGQLILEQQPRQVGVVMGCVAMTAGAYRNARYADHILGEDVGWAIQCEAMGIERWICPRARGQHLYRLDRPPSVKQP